jgi:hypothetical protein
VYFKDIGDHAWSFVPTIGMIRELGMLFNYQDSSRGCAVQVADRDAGRQLAQFAEFSDGFLKATLRIMEADTSLENGLELLSCCRDFVDRCRVFEHFVQKLFGRIVEVRFVNSCYLRSINHPHSIAFSPIRAVLASKNSTRAGTRCSHRGTDWKFASWRKSRA